MWVVFVYTAFWVFVPSPWPTSKAGFVMSIIVVLIPRTPIYLVWTTCFILLRMVVSKRKVISFWDIFSFALVLNFAELLFFYSDFGRIVNASKHYGWFNTKTWATLPDFPAVLSLILVTVVFAALHFRFVEKRFASING